MKVLTDENVAQSVVKKLRENGFDVKTVKELGLSSAEDKQILNAAYKDGRIIITHDKDFGYLLRQHKHAGVILLRFAKPFPDKIANAVVQLLKSSLRKKIKGQFVVMSEQKVTIHRNF